MADEAKTEEQAAPKAASKKQAAKKPETVRTDAPKRKQVTNRSDAIARTAADAKPRNVEEMGNGTKREDY